ncbi:MAG: hypothetical protein ACI398_04030 [Clostridium sp.]
MSGGHFDYNQWRISEIADQLEDYIYGHPIDEEDINEYLEDRWLDEETRAYIIKNKHTIPNNYSFNKDTIKEFKKGLSILRKAYIYAQRIDWLLSGDDGEESFHRRLKEELDNLKNKKNESTRIN